MTERLYYTDLSLTEFEGRIIDAGMMDNQHYTVLDRSAFYPTSGGQSHDTGTINGVEIVDVIETDPQDVRHLSLHTVGKVGEEVTGRIDHERRRRNSQMHTAQHILSSVLIDHCQAHTVSVHLGDQYGAVELSVSQLSPDDLATAEQRANDVIFQGLPVEITFAESDQLREIPLRKTPERTGKLRVVRIGDLDYSACGGTHCNNTAQVGLLKITGAEKLRGHLLVRFLSGSLAVRDYHTRFDVTDSLTRTFTCAVEDLPVKLEKLATENRALHKEIGKLHRELLPVKIDQLSRAVRQVGRFDLVSQDVSEVDASIVNLLASQLADEIQGVTVLLASRRLVLATAESTELDAGRIIRQFVEQQGLKGGGSARMAQVGGVAAERFEEYVGILDKLLADR